MRKRLAIVLLCLCFIMRLYSQDLSPARKNRWVDSIQTLLNFPSTLSQWQNIDFDSAGKSNFKKLIKLDTAELAVFSRLKFPQKDIPKIKKSFLKFNGGIINYNWNYRSSIDTPFAETAISQNLITARLGFTMAGYLPITVTYFERQSNSAYFRDYRDVRIEFNASEFQKLQAIKLNSYVNSLTDKLHDPLLKPSLDLAGKKIFEIDDWLNQRLILNKLIGSRAVIANGGSIDSMHRMDTSLKEAKEFIKFYEEVKGRQQKLRNFRDSLQKEYVTVEKKIVSLKKILSMNIPFEEKSKALENLMEKQGLETGQFRKIYGVISSVRTFAIGKVLPNYSDLTLKNINVNGINLEYNKRIYLALTAGAIDYRARDFFYKNQKGKPQYVYFGRMGYGEKQGSHVYITVFKGKKQLLSNRNFTPSLDIYGVSLESQVLFTKNIRFIGEIAQSATPVLIGSNGLTEKSSFQLKDEKNKAYSLKLNSFFPKTRSRLEVSYQYRGLYFQSFSSYYTNAAVHRWSVKAEQYFWKRQLKIDLSVAKNNFENNYLPVRYSGNTVFKTLHIALRKNKWPGFQLGYTPSSQLSVIDGQVYENFYQTITIGASHNYKLGTARGFSVINYNRFFNDSKDSGFIYYNAKNIYASQLIQFSSFNSTLGFTRTTSRDYTLTVMEAGFSKKLLKQSILGFGVKINQLNNESVRLGVYGSGRIVIPKLGELSVWIEKTYFPGSNGTLVRNELYNIGFTRFFK